jgi:putative tricarboxylic transport membrane protein
VSRGDVISGSVLAALGVYIVIEARGWDYSGPDGPGPGFFPLWYGIAMIVLAAALVALNLRGAPAQPRKPLAWREVRRVFLVWASFLACVVSLKYLGFVLGFALFVLFLVRAMYGRTWGTALAVSAGAAVGFYLLFAVALDVRLPAGPLGI